VRADAVGAGAVGAGPARDHLVGTLPGTGGPAVRSAA